MLEQEVRPCKECESLGNTPNGNWFFTISPDPLSQPNNHASTYDNIPAEMQASRILRILRKAMTKFKLEFGTSKAHVHWELNKSGMIHAHGIVTVFKRRGHYDLVKSKFGRYVSDYLGRPHICYKVCCLLLDVTRDDFEYVNKENTFKPNTVDCDVVTTDEVIALYEGSLDRR